jgi:hypothetical protein
MILVLGLSYVENLRLLCEDRSKPHQWENTSNARGKVSVQMHGYSGGTVKRLTKAIDTGLFVHYTRIRMAFTSQKKATLPFLWH